ncbi:myo-inositol-1-phosphate synthase, partial [Aureobasidium melanogenum]
VTYSDDAILSKYVYRQTKVTKSSNGGYVATPKETVYDFKVERKVGRVGMMLVGWGGNNGSTVTAGIIANRQGLTWDTREGKQSANYYGSMVMSSTVKLGTDSDTGKEIYVPFNELLPMVNPNDLVIGGWDISSMNIAESMDRAGVLEPTLKQMVRKEMAQMVPLPSIYYPDFIAANQESRADNILEGSKACNEHLEKIRADIREFKSKHNLDKIIVQWTANTERYADILPGVNDTADNLLKSIASGHPEIAPSTIFATACILENAPFINGSPQNTFVPGVIALAEQHSAFIGGDDFKSGQTKMKSALVDFLINAGIKVKSLASYNHLGNNDGRNLSAPSQFRSNNHPPPDDLTHQPFFAFYRRSAPKPHAFADLTRFVCDYHADFARPSTRPLPITLSLADSCGSPSERCIFPSAHFAPSHDSFSQVGREQSSPDSRSLHPLDSPFDPTSLSVVIADSFERLKSSPPLSTLFSTFLHKPSPVLSDNSHLQNTMDSQSNQHFYAQQRPAYHQASYNQSTFTSSASLSSLASINTSPDQTNMSSRQS